MSKHKEAPVDVIDTARQKGRAEYDKLMPRLLHEHTDWTIVINVGEPSDNPYALSVTADGAKQLAETLEWTAFYVRAVGENTLGTESVVIVG